MHVAPVSCSSDVERPRLSSHREHVFLIDSCAAAASVAIPSLEAHGYRVTWVERAQQALSIVLSPTWFSQQSLADVVLFDIDREEISPASFGQILRATGPGMTPVVLLGSHPMAELQKHVQRGAAVGGVRKPLEPDELLRTVRASLGHGRRRMPQSAPSFFGDITRPVATGLLS
jgi:DNA-binding NtrC family response regulator